MRDLLSYLDNPLMNMTESLEKAIKLLALIRSTRCTEIACDRCLLWIHFTSTSLKNSTKEQELVLQILQH